MNKLVNFAKNNNMINALIHSLRFVLDVKNLQFHRLPHLNIWSL